jgi:GR25 family glycosyltransferase involved in LPS biosynthesis
MTGLNHFNIIYYINLNHRTDRLENIKRQLTKTNIELNKINRISGIYMKDFGILGCAKSHILALEEFIKSNNDNCLILEDDFCFTESQDFINNLIDQVFNNKINYDVLMLSCNILNGQETEHSFLTKIFDGQTLSGYSVSKKFAPTLLNNFKESVYLLEKEKTKVHPFCFDIYMKKLQPTSKWYCLQPRIGKQIESYSDIENKVVEYDC